MFNYQKDITTDSYTVDKLKYHHQDCLGLPNDEHAYGMFHE